MTNPVAQRPQASTRSPAPESWRSHAFGLTIEGDFATEIFDPIARPGARRVTLRTAPRRAFAGHWNEERAVRRFEGRRPNGRVVLTISTEPKLGYHIWGEAHGDYVISPDGKRITCFPGRLANERWQRFLIGQVLPLAASLQGLEILHASAVRIGDQAVGLVGDSGAGKTSVAGFLLLRGAKFVADDVIAVERRGEDLLANPGTALIAIKAGQPDLVAELGRRRIAAVLSVASDETLCKIVRPARPAPLGRLYFIDRRGYAGPVRFEPVEDARLLMAATFSLVQRDPARLERLLDVAARIVLNASAYWIRVPEGMTAPELARSVESHLT